MWLEVALIVLVGLTIGGLLTLIAILIVPEISLSDLAFGVIIWCVTLLFLGRFYTRQLYYHDRYEREDVSHQNIKFTGQKIADFIGELQKLGFQRLGEIISRAQFIGEQKNPGWYLINESIPALAGITKVGNKVAFVTYFADGGVVTTYSTGVPEIHVGSYFQTSSGIDSLQETLIRHQQNIDTHIKQYGSPVNVRTIPDLLSAIGEVERIQQERIKPVQRRLLLILVAKLSFAFSLFWISMQVVFRSDSSPEKIMITLVIWLGCMIFLRYRSDRLGKGKVKKEGENMEDPLYLATLNYYSG